MFTYIDPTVRQKLIDQGKLIRVNYQGEPVSATESPGDQAINIMGPIPLPVHRGTAHQIMQWYVAVRHTELSAADDLARQLRETGEQRSFADLVSAMSVNSVLVVGDLEKAKKPLVRVHSSCLTGDVFGSERCECGPQLESALSQVASDPEGGMIIYMSGHEGRGIGLWAKAATYILQDGGDDTYQANRNLGLPDDCRDFSDAGALLLHFLGDRPFRLLTNNPKKVTELEEIGLTQIERVKHVIGVGASNRRYLSAKQGWGHLLEDDDLHD